MRPHRRQPTRLRRPWDSPGKNTGVGCHFLLQCRKVKSESDVAQSCPTPRDPMDCSPPGSSVHGIFQARVLEPYPAHCLSPEGQGHREGAHRPLEPLTHLARRGWGEQTFPVQGAQSSPGCPAVQTAQGLFHKASLHWLSQGEHGVDGKARNYSTKFILSNRSHFVWRGRERRQWKGMQRRAHGVLLKVLSLQVVN